MESHTQRKGRPMCTDILIAKTRGGEKGEGCRGTERLETGKEWENKSEQIHNGCSKQ